jgi:zinc protease
VLRDPVFPATEFEQARQQSIQGLENQRQQPAAVASLAMQRHLDPYPAGHPRHVYTVDERLAALRALTVDEVKKFYGEFYGADVAEMAVVGDFEADAVATLADELFKGWKSQRAVVRLTSLWTDVAPINRSFETPDKANANFNAGMSLPLRQDDPDYPALVLANYMIGGDFNSRLTARVRQKEGISYGIGSSLGADVFDKSGTFTISAIAAPENIARGESAVKEELARALKDGFTADELKVAKQGWLQSREVTRTEDFSIASSLRAYLYQGRTFTWDADFERKVQALSADQIVAALRRHIDPAKLTVMKAGDFAKK